ncbi:MAG: zinc-ribbon domain-containing protein [Alphaproteobacteria bacterium]|nr:zinc-ribbon domain-containing protein [Alphaproteobacteria bacterium]
MIISCGLCNTRYLVSASLFAFGPRMVRCARCRHSWQADMPSNIDVFMRPPPPMAEPEPPVSAPEPAQPDSPTPLPQVAEKTTDEGKSAPKHTIKLPALTHVHLSLAKKISIIAGVVLGTALALTLILARQTIAKNVPFMEPIYNAIGLHIVYLGEGLDITDVRSELTYDSGIMRLMIDGKIVNNIPRIHKIPPIIALATGADGLVIQRWQIDPPKATLDPLASVAFHSEINAPPMTVVHVNLNFVEIKDDTQ